MTLNGVGEPPANRHQRITQAIKIGLFTQWQTYNNGVHMDDDTFGSIDFPELARQVLKVLDVGDPAPKLITFPLTDEPSVARDIGTMVDDYNESRKQVSETSNMADSATVRQRVDTLVNAALITMGKAIELVTGRADKVTLLNDLNVAQQHLIYASRDNE